MSAKAIRAALERVVDILDSNVMGDIGGGPENAPALLRWTQQRLVRIEGADPRAGHVRALVTLADKLEAAIEEGQKALAVGKPD